MTRLFHSNHHITWSLTWGWKLTHILEQEESAKSFQICFNKSLVRQNHKTNFLKASDTKHCIFAGKLQKALPVRRRAHLAFNLIDGWLDLQMGNAAAHPICFTYFGVSTSLTAPVGSWLSVPCIISREPRQTHSNQSLHHLIPAPPLVWALYNDEVLRGLQGTTHDRKASFPPFLSLEGRFDGNMDAESNQRDIILAKCTKHH